MHTHRIKEGGKAANNWRKAFMQRPLDKCGQYLKKSEKDNGFFIDLVWTVVCRLYTFNISCAIT